jgi:hypothetical protein
MKKKMQVYTDKLELTFIFHNLNPQFVAIKKFVKILRHQEKTNDQFPMLPE